MKEYIVKTGLLDRPRRLVLTSDFIAFENKNLKSDLVTRLQRADIVDIKRGIERIIWYEFPVGYEYSFTFLDKDYKTLDIRFSDYFGLQSHYKQFYMEMTKLVWDYYFNGIVDLDIDEIYGNGEIELNHVKIGLDGIKFLHTNEAIDWKDVDYKEYFDYFALHRKDNSNVYRTFRFNEWNSERLFCIVKTIKNDRGIERTPQ